MTSLCSNSNSSRMSIRLHHKKQLKFKKSEVNHLFKIIEKIMIRKIRLDKIEIPIKFHNDKAIDKITDMIINKTPDKMIDSIRNEIVDKIIDLTNLIDKIEWIADRMVDMTGDRMIDRIGEMIIDKMIEMRARVVILPNIRNRLLKMQKLEKLSKIIHKASSIRSRNN